MGDVPCLRRAGIDAGRRPVLGHHGTPEVGDPDDWTVLLALHPDRIDVLDLGADNVMVPIADLLPGRWDRVVIDISSC
jgi:hypothetical protein